MAEPESDAKTDGNVDDETVQNSDVDALKVARSGNDVVRFTDSTSSSSSSSSSEHSFPRSPDGGWGWVIVAASFAAHAIVDGYSCSVGVLFDHLLEELGESTATTAWVLSLFVSMPSICGPIASILTNQFGCKRVTIAGGLIAATGCILAAFSNSIGTLCLTFGVVAGFGLSLVCVPAVIIVAYYFNKRRAFALGVATAGSGIGGFMFPPLVNYLLQVYSRRGAFIILGAIMLHIVICGALFRPLVVFKLQRKRRRYLRSLERFSHVSSRRASGDAIDSHSQRTSNSRDSDPAMVPCGDLQPVSHSLILLPTYLETDLNNTNSWPVSHLLLDARRDSQSLDNVSSIANEKQAFQHKLETLRNGNCGNVDTYFSSDADDDVEAQVVCKVKAVKMKHKAARKRSPHYTEHYLPDYRRDICYRGSLLKAGYLLRHGQSASCPDVFVHSRCKQSGRAVDRLCIAFTKLRAHIHDNIDFSIFRSPLFILFCIHSMLLYLSYEIPYLYIPDHAETLNVSENYASFLISIIGIASTFGQVLMGYIGDKSWINRLVFYIAMTCIAGFATTMVPLLSSFGLLAAYCAVYGFFMSANFSLTTIIVLELLGMDQLTNAYGFVTMAEGLANVFGPPLAGWLRDGTDSYNASFVASGVGVCCSGFLLLVAPLLRRCDHVAVTAESKSDVENSEPDASVSKSSTPEHVRPADWNSD